MIKKNTTKKLLENILETLGKCFLISTLIDHIFQVIDGKGGCI